MLAYLAKYNFADLRVLSLASSCEITDIGFKVLLMCASLEELTLRKQHGLSLTSAKMIGRLAQLRCLSVQESRSLNDDQALEAYSGLACLKSLWLGSSTRTLGGLWHLPPGLRDLEVESTHVQDASSYLNLLSKFPGIKTIRRGLLIVYRKGQLGFNLGT
jgi:hypothetical protein